MRQASIKLIGILAVSIGIFPLTAWAGSRPVGDFIGLGDVQRGGVKLGSDSTVFEGDALRTGASSGGVIRIGRGRVELGESSEVVIERQSPLWIVVKYGTMSFSFPEGTDVTILTPQLRVTPEHSAGRLSGRIEAVPEKEDQVDSHNGIYRIAERLPGGDDNHVNVIHAMQQLIAVFQGPMRGTRIAVLELIDRQVYTARAATPKNYVLMTERDRNLPLASGDRVKTVQGKARILFTDMSVITLNIGTSVEVTESRAPAGVTRQVTQYLGSLWFKVTSGQGQTTMATPTAVAAIRGTEGVIDVPSDSETTFALNEGVEDLTELVTGKTLTLHTAQVVTAYRGVGFGTVFAILNAIAEPFIASSVGGAGGGGAGGAGGGGAGAGGGGAGAGGGGAAGGGAGGGAASNVATNTAASAVSTSTAAAASTISSVATLAATTGFSALATAAIVPITVHNQPRASGSQPPLSFPGA